MFPIHTILHPTDFSRQADQALYGRIDFFQDAVSGIQIVAGDELPEVVEVLGRQGGEDVPTHGAS